MEADRHAATEKDDLGDDDCHMPLGGTGLTDHVTTSSAVVMMPQEEDELRAVSDLRWFDQQSVGQEGSQLSTIGGRCGSPQMACRVHADYEIDHRATKASLQRLGVPPNRTITRQNGVESPLRCAAYRII